MENFTRFLETFVNEDAFLLFLIIMVLIILILVVALFKIRQEYLDLLNKDRKLVLEKSKDEDFNLDSLKATSPDDVVKENESFIKTVNIPTIETYDDIIEKYEASEEENAVISSEELEKKKKERMEELGVSDNQAIIQKYEDEQERKAIISYEQLVKNASNITLTYTEEEPKNAKAPKVNKIAVEEKEITPVENYVNEEEFLKILKEFRLKLE